MQRETMLRKARIAILQIPDVMAHVLSHNHMLDQHGAKVLSLDHMHMVNVCEYESNTSLQEPDYLLIDYLNLQDQLQHYNNLQLLHYGYYDYIQMYYLPFLEFVYSLEALYSN